LKYKEALGYLEYLQEFRIKLGLERMRALSEILGHPWRSYYYIIIAGTNGKGSVGAFLTSILSKRYRVGFNSSPHLVSPRERIRLNGHAISEEDFGFFIGKVARASEKINYRFPHPVTFFETLTAAAMLAFQEWDVDVGIFEVGMGGRLDATNIADENMSILTEIDLDHTRHLGKTVEEIAKEKAFVIKNGISVIGTEKDSVKKIFQERAESRGVKSRIVFSENNFRILEPMHKFWFKGEDEYVFSPSLPGNHQGRNASIAISAAEELKEQGFSISKEDILSGVSSAFWPGRLETAGKITLDGVHNCHASISVGRYLEETGPWDTMIFTIMRDKDYRCMGRNLFPHFRRIILTEVESRRKMPAEQLLPLASRYAEVHIEKNPYDALSLAGEMSRGKIFVGGSLYLIGKIRERLLEEGVVDRL